MAQEITQPQIHLPGAALAQAILEVSEVYGRPDCGFVYFIKCEQFVKIGHARNVPGRASELSVGNPFPLVLVGCLRGDRTLERAMHSRLRKRHHRGDWFRWDDEMQAALELISWPVELPSGLEPPTSRRLPPIVDWKRYRAAAKRCESAYLAAAEVDRIKNLKAKNRRLARKNDDLDALLSQMTS